MLSAKAQYSLRDAKHYFKEHLSVGDYYTEGQHVAGQWFGRGAADLGLTGVTTAEQFVRLCDNLHPQTGEQLTLRQKTTRTESDAAGNEREVANRRVFYDFTFSPAKSVSIAALVGDDARIVEAHERAVIEALNQLQGYAATRVRKNSQCTDRSTGNIVAAVFRHETSRALDPHLHSHCILFNATFDPVERQWKALQNRDMFAAQKFVENVYYHELARELRQFGYAIENQPRGDFEIKGIAPALIEKFSKRHQQIDEQTRELLARAPEKADGNIAAIRENIAHRERPPKVCDLGTAKLRALWSNQLTPLELDSLRGIAVPAPVASRPSADAAEKAVIWAEEHLFERRSIIHEHELWRHALERLRGQNVSLGEIQAVTKQRGYLRFENHPGQISTQEHLQRESEIVNMVRSGIGEGHPLAFDYQSRNPQLDPEQREAVESIMSRLDNVILFRGGAGTGKTFILREVQREIQATGRTVHVLAPQRQQVMELEREGFQNTKTLSAFLTARPQLARTDVLLVDEAGQIGGKQMHALLELATESGARVILSGDTRQHGAVEATDALKAIEKHAGLRIIELQTIRRQNPAVGRDSQERERIKEYRRAVEEARDGRLIESFERLERLKTIEQCAPGELHQKLAARYLELVQARLSTVVVSQSWNEIHKVNDEIRTALRREKRIAETETLVTSLQPVDLTAAQKRDARSYDKDSVLVFNRNARGFKAGQSARLHSITDTHLIVGKDSRTAAIPFKELGKVTVCQSKEMPLATGDRLQLKANGRSANNRKLANGELVTVKAVKLDGRIVLIDGRVLSSEFRQFVRGYAVTSYAAQGKSVDHVLFADSAVKAATNKQQWYVTISRGKRGIHIFTTDKEQLRENIQRGDNRPSVIDQLAAFYRLDHHFQTIKRRWGQRMAVIMTMNIRGNRARQARQQRQVQVQAVEQTVRMASVPAQTETPQKQSRGIGL